MMIVHILRMYNSKHPCTWDEILPYVQHSYNRSLHNSIGHNPFQVCLGFQPLAPIDVALPIATAHRKSPPMLRPRLIGKPNLLSTSNTSNNKFMILCRNPMPSTSKCHDQHRVPHKFQVGDKVWLHLQKECLTGPHWKLCPL
jgi:hypothetical protein